MSVGFRSAKPGNEYRFCAKTLKSMMELLVERYGTNRLQAVIPENMNGPIKLSFEEYGFEIDMFCDEVTREDGVCLVLEEEKDTFFLIINGCKINPCLLYTSPSPRDRQKSRMPSSA